AQGSVGGGRDKAERQANSLISLDPARAHWVNARIAEKKKDFATAESEYRGAIEVSHGSASSWLNLGLFYRHREQFDMMEQALTHVRPASLDRSVALVDADEISWDYVSSLDLYPRSVMSNSDECPGVVDETGSLTCANS